MYHFRTYLCCKVYTSRMIFNILFECVNTYSFNRKSKRALKKSHTNDLKYSCNDQTVNLTFNNDHNLSHVLRCVVCRISKCGYIHVHDWFCLRGESSKSMLHACELWRLIVLWRKQSANGSSHYYTFGSNRSVIEPATSNTRGGRCTTTLPRRSMSLYILTRR